MKPSFIRHAVSCLTSALVIASGLAVAAGAVCIFCSGRQPGEIYSREIAGELLLELAPLFLVTLLMLVVSALMKLRGQDRPVERRKLKQKVLPAEKQDPRRAGRIQAALLLAAILLIISGIMNGGLHDVLVKAINICTECIGLG